MKYKKIIIIIIITILIVILVPFIKNKIMLYNVKNNYYKAITNLNRSGNFHIIVTNYNEENKMLREYFGKDGTIITLDYDKNDDVDIIRIGSFDKNILIYPKRKEYINHSLDDELNMESFYKTFNATGETPYIYYGSQNNINVKSIKEGKYNKKECYILEIIVDKEKKQKVYIDKKNYLPLLEITDIEDEYSNVHIKREYNLIEIGKVTELPQYNLDEYTLLEI